MLSGITVTRALRIAGQISYKAKLFTVVLEICTSEFDVQVGLHKENVFYIHTPFLLLAYNSIQKGYTQKIALMFKIDKIKSSIYKLRYQNSYLNLMEPKNILRSYYHV